MKCPMCLGKGYATDEDIKEYPHRCPNCNGKGFYSVDWQRVRCEVCNGSGKKPQTNEEWLRSATFEELAGAIYEWHSAGYTKGRLGLGLNPITEVVEWLKQPHTIKE